MNELLERLARAGFQAFVDNAYYGNPQPQFTWEAAGDEDVKRGWISAAQAILEEYQKVCDEEKPLTVIKIRAEDLTPEQIKRFEKYTDQHTEGSHG